MTRTLVAAALLLALAPAARADSDCLADAAKHCPDVPFGDGRVMACLDRHRNELSSGCITDLQRFTAKAREVTSQCKSEVWAHCQGVAPGGGRIRACLLERWDVLGDLCKQEVARVEEKAAKVWAACEGDALRLCAGMTLGGGQVYACLKAQESKVTSACYQALR